MGLFSSIADLINPPVRIYIVVGKDRNPDADNMWISEVFEEMDEALHYMHDKTTKYQELRSSMNLGTKIPVEILYRFFYKFCDQVDIRAKAFSVHGVIYDIIEWEVK